MNSQKSLLAKLIETIDQHRAERRTVAAPQEQRPSNLPRFVRWFPTPGNVLFTLLIAGLLVMTQNIWATPNLASVPGASATTVNYQGRLENSSGNPLNGPQNLQFAIYDADTSGNLIWGPESHTSVPVSDGLFSVGLGSQTAGGIPTTTWDGDRYLEITVNSETLTPRELIRSVPIAGMALTVPDGSISSEKLNLNQDDSCLSGNTTVTIPGGFVKVDVPGLSLSLTVQQASKVMVWMDGAAKFNVLDGRESAFTLMLEDTGLTSTLSYVHPRWFTLHGVRVIDLEPGTYTLKGTVSSSGDGEAIIHGGGAHQTCINYLVLG